MAASACPLLPPTIQEPRMRCGGERRGRSLRALSKNELCVIRARGRQYWWQASCGKHPGGTRN
eukprot:2593545-Pyramimonas_sp.AAC.1